MAFELTHTIDAQNMVLQFTGRLDTQASVDTEAQLLNLLAQAPKRVILDMSALEYIASAGLRIVLLALKHAKQHQQAVALAGLQESIKHIFQISGFLNLVQNYDSSEQALTALSNQ